MQPTRPVTLPFALARAASSAAAITGIICANVTQLCITLIVFGATCALAAVLDESTFHGATRHYAGLGAATILALAAAVSHGQGVWSARHRVPGAPDHEACNVPSGADAPAVLGGALVVAAGLWALVGGGVLLAEWWRGILTAHWVMSPTVLCVGLFAPPALALLAAALGTADALRQSAVYAWRDDRNPARHTPLAAAIGGGVAAVFVLAFTRGLEARVLLSVVTLFSAAIVAVIAPPRRGRRATVALVEDRTRSGWGTALAVATITLTCGVAFVSPGAGLSPSGMRSVERLQFAATADAGLAAEFHAWSTRLFERVHDPGGGAELGRTAPLEPSLVDGASGRAYEANSHPSATAAGALDWQIDTLFGSFDAVVIHRDAAAVLDHAAAERFIRRAARSLRPGGRLLVEATGGAKLGEPADDRRSLSQHALAAAIDFWKSTRDERGWQAYYLRVERDARTPDAPVERFEALALGHDIAAWLHRQETPAGWRVLVVPISGHRQFWAAAMLPTAALMPPPTP